MKELDMRILKKVSRKKYVPCSIMDEADVSGLDYCYNYDGSDAWHVRLGVRSVYPSMDDIKEYIHSIHPEYSTHAWSLRRTYDGGAECRGGDWFVRIDPKTMESIKRTHIDYGVYENCVKSWCHEISYMTAEWFDMESDTRITKDVLRKLSAKRAGWLADMDADDLTGYLSNPEYDGEKLDVLGMLAAGLEYAKRHRCALFARVVD